MLREYENYWAYGGIKSELENFLILSKLQYNDNLMSLKENKKNNILYIEKKSLTSSYFNIIIFKIYVGEIIECEFFIEHRFFDNSFKDILHSYNIFPKYKKRSGIIEHYKINIDSYNDVKNVIKILLAINETLNKKEKR